MLVPPLQLPYFKYNSHDVPLGLLVLNVAGMRKYGWTKRWEAEVTERLTLGDSDAYNGMASRHR